MKKTAVIITILLAIILSSCGNAAPGEEPGTQGTLSSVIIEGTSVLGGENNDGDSSSLLPETSIVYRLPELTPKEGFPEGKPLPPISVADEREMAAYHIFPDGNYWVIYTVRPFGMTVINELCTTSDGGVTWNRLSHPWNGYPVDMFVIDPDCAIVLTDDMQMGYGFYVLENKGMDVRERYTTASSFKTPGEPDCGFLFPTEPFISGDVNSDEKLFYDSVTAYYIEPIDSDSCRIVLEYEINGRTSQKSAIFDRTGVHKENVGIN